MKRLKHYRKIYIARYVALYICLILLLTGCRISPTGSASTIPITSSTVSFPGNIPISSTAIYSSPTLPPLSSMTASQLERLKNIRLVFLQVGDFGQNICAFENGSPLATGLVDGPHDPIVSQKLSDGADLFMYDISYPYTNFPSSPSEIKYPDDIEVYKMTHDNRYYEYGFARWIAFSDNDDPFKFPVSHQAYGAGAQPDRPEWQAAFTPLLEEKMAYDNEISDTPFIITDVWLFDLDGDGIDEELVRACNQVKMDETEFELKPASKNTGVYNIMILFSKTLKTSILSDERVYIGETPDESGANLYESIRGTDSRPRTTEISVWQYNSEGNLILCPFYQYGESRGILLPQIPIVCDADNDGKPELIVIKRPNEYWRVAVYKAGLENGELLWCENIMHP